MTSSDGESAPRPLRKRKSKRFDRTGGSARSAGSAVAEPDIDPELDDDIDEFDESVSVEVDAEPTDGVEGELEDLEVSSSDSGASDEASSNSDADDGSSSEDDVDDVLSSEPDDLDESSSESEADDDDSSSEPDDLDESSSDDSPADQATSEIEPVDGAGRSFLSEATGRSKTLDELSTCGRCGHEVSMINIEVDSNVLVMESCDNCDIRRWHLAGEQVELEHALDHVGEHAGRRR